MDPFLSVVASAFPGRAGILYSNLKGQAKPEGCYPNRPAGGTRRGSGYHRGRKSPSDNTHRRPSSASRARRRPAQGAKREKTEGGRAASYSFRENSTSRSEKHSERAPRTKGLPKETAGNSKGSPLEAFADSIGTKQRKRRNGERKGARAVLLGAKAAGSGAGYGTKGPRTSRRDFLGNPLPCCKQSNLTLVALLSFLAGRKHTSSAGGVLILCDNTTERVALLGGQLCDTEKATLSCHMLWSQCPYEVVMSFTRSKPGPRAVRKIGLDLNGTTHPTLPPIGGRPSYSRPKRNCSDLE
uniref:Uncharacterized protein n=1 Tax=Populus alba TaxID=43335 RepID=A0A4V6XWU7_POPAL|nr:hypothetical protein D5086_0000160670 [Populus alba]